MFCCECFGDYCMNAIMYCLCIDSDPDILNYSDPTESLIFAKDNAKATM